MPRWVAGLIWAVLLVSVLIGLSGLVSSATFPRAIASHPIRTKATVSAVYMGGFTPDPSYDYSYQVQGVEYTGSGDSNLGVVPVTDLRPGDQVTVEYAAAAPSESCSCDAVRDAPASTLSAAILAAALSLPLLLRVAWRVRTRGFGLPQSFVRVRGFGEWVAFVVGLAIAVLFAIVFVAYCVSNTIQH